MNKKSQAEDKLGQIKIKACRPFIFKIAIYDNLFHNINEKEIIYFLKGCRDCEL